MASLVLNGNTSGSVTISSPAVSGTTTLTLPTSSGTITVAGVNSNIVSGTAQATTSGTSKDFTDIPSWVKRITVMFAGVSTSGTSNYQIQVGSGSVVTSGYLGSSVDGPTLTGTSFTTGFGLRTAGAGVVVHGTVSISNVSSNNWVASGILTRSDTAVFISTAGSISIGGALDRVRITTVNGTDTFDAGSINILYE